MADAVSLTGALLGTMHHRNFNRPYGTQRRRIGLRMPANELAGYSRASLRDVEACNAMQNLCIEMRHITTELRERFREDLIGC